MAYNFIKRFSYLKVILQDLVVKKIWWFAVWKNLYRISRKIKRVLGIEISLCKEINSERAFHIPEYYPHDFLYWQQLLDLFLYFRVSFFFYSMAYIFDSAM